MDFESVWSSSETDSSAFAAWGDYDNDGDLDQFVANYGQPNRIYRNNGGNSFSLVWSSAESDSSGSADWGDYDGDGDLDLLVGNSGVNRVYRNNGGDSFSLIWSSTETDNTYSVAWGDSDGDGDLDQLVGNGGAGEANRVYRNDGNNSFTLVWTSAETEETASAAWCDFDKDGDPDQLIGNTGVAGAANRVYRNDGANSFTAVWASVEAEPTTSVACGDYDGDGDPDQLVGNTDAAGAVNRVYRNDGAFSFTNVWTSTETDSTMSVAWGDYDGDGDLDQLIGNSPGEANRVYGNDGGGAFSLFWSSTETEDTRALAWGDSDGDGDLDMLAANYAQANRVYRNNLNPANAAPSQPTLTAEDDAAAGVVILNWSASTDDHTPASAITYQLRVGTCAGCDNIVSGAFAPPMGNAGAATAATLTLPVSGMYYWSVAAIDNTGFAKSAWAAADSFFLGAAAFASAWTSAQTDNTNVVAWGDYDRDGDLDQLAGNYNQVNRVYRNDGGGVFTLAWSSAETDRTRGVAWGDYDRDGDLDQLIGNYGEANRVYRNDGADTFTLAWSSTQTDQTYTVEWGDYDNDGDLDQLVGNYAQANRVYKNDGGGGFTLAWSSTELDQTFSAAWGDYDDDGDLDQLVGNYNSNVNRVYRNDGADTFALAWSSPQADSTYSVAWADFDADGDLDQLVGNYTEANRIYRNDGADAFTLLWSSSEFYETTSVAAGDYDGDGDLDQLAANWNRANNAYRNNGSGSFGMKWSSTEVESTTGVAWGDYDGDGDIDQLTAIYGAANRLYANNANPSNSPPSAPALDAEPDTRLTGATASVTLTWSGAADDITPATLLTYQVRVGTCSGCGNVVSGVFAPPRGNAGEESFTLVVSATGTYYWSAATVDTTGFATSAWAVESAFTILEGIPPTVIDNQAGDDAWRNASGTVYDVDFDDTGGSLLNYVEYTIWSGPAMTGSELKSWTTIATGIAASSYSADWAIDFDAATDGVNYVSARAADNAGNVSAVATDVFYLKKDVTPPQIVDNQAGDDTWHAASGTVYDVDFKDENASLLDYVQYAMWSGPAMSGAELKSWTDIATGIAAASYTTDWEVDFDAATDGVNYISVRAFDNAGNPPATGTDVFYLQKDLSAPATGPVIPANTDTGVYVDGAFDLGASFSDTLSGIVSCDYCLSVDGNCDSEWAAATWTAPTCVANSLACADGAALTLNMRAVNGSGSTATATAVARTCDTQPPTTTDDWVDVWTATSPLTVSFSANDTASAVKSSYYCIDTADACAPATVGASASVTCSSGATCTQFVRYFSADNVDNAEAVNSKQVRQDRQGPVGGWIGYDITPPITFYSQENWDVYFATGTDAESGVASHVMQRRSAALTNGSCGSYNSWTGYATDPVVSPWTDTAATTGYCHQYRLVETDNLGNQTITCWDGLACSFMPPVGVDMTAPPAPTTVNDGTGADADFAGSLTQLSANWSDATDPESGLVMYWMAIGTSPGATDTFDFTNAGNVTATTVTGLSLTNNQAYYFTVKARNYTNLYSSTTSSDGQTTDNTPPTQLTYAYDGAGADVAYATSSSQLSANWSASTDGESGIAQYLYAVGTTAGATNVVTFTSAGTATGVTKTSLSLTDGQTYYVSAVAENGAGLWSTATTSNGQLVDASLPSTIQTVLDGAGADADYATSTTQLSAEWSGSADTHSGLAGYWYAIGTSPGATNTVDWTANAGATGVTKTGLTLTSGQAYYFSVKSKNNAGLESAVTSSDGTLVDAGAPSAIATVNDGTGADISVTTSSTELSANWSASADAESGVAKYLYAIGTTAGATNVVNFTSAGTATFVTKTGLSLTNGQTYYFSVKAENGAGLQSAAANSNGQTVSSIFGSVWTSPETDRTHSAAWGDCDGDGDLDQIAGNGGTNGELNRVYQNAGSNSFIQAWWSAPEADKTSSVAWGDYDNDGDLDILAGNRDQPNRIYNNIGSCVFTLVWSSAESDTTENVAWGDYDSDGDLDVFAGNDGQSNRIYRNDGSGAFNLAWSSTETDRTFSSAWADYDNDGDLDVFVGNYLQSNRLYKNNGNGSFTVAWSSDDTDATKSVAAGDYNADGRPDVLVGNSSLAYGNRVYQGDGAGGFTIAWTSPQNESTYSAAWGDYDGDGDLDILAANAGNGEVNRVYTNDGGGSFTSAWTSSETEKTESVAWGDYDGDGDLDILAGNNNQVNRVYRNNLNLFNAAPGAPTTTAEPDGVAGAVTLQWTASSDAVTPAALLGYQVRIGSTPGGSEVASDMPSGYPGNAGATTSFKVNLGGGTYYWSVAAIDTTGFAMSSWSAEDSFTLGDTNPPTFAGISSVSTCDSECLQLMWLPASDPEGAVPITYNIYYSPVSGAQNFAAPNASSIATTTQITGLGNGTTYYIVVRAEDSAGNEETNTVERTGTPVSNDTSAPATPSTFIAVAYDQQVNLSWVNPANTDFAEVVLVRNSGAYPTSINDGTVVYQGAGTSFANSGLTNGTTYYYNLYACDSTPNCSYAQAYATPNNAVYLSIEPGWNLVGMSVTPSSGATSTIFAGYQVFVCEYSGATWLCDNDSSFPGMSLARAYWVKSDVAASSISFSGSKTNAGTYEIALTAGWNGIANPYSDPLPWDDSNITLRESTGAPVALSAATSLIRPTLYYYVTAQQAYGKLPAGGFSLPPWKGYWIKALKNCTLIIKKP